LGEIRHTITHHHYRFTVATATARVPKGPFRWFKSEEMETVPLSTTARKALSTVRLSKP
jgi:adenine-specific DNA glycosylase